ncbi:MAG TPA: nitroreductase family protein [Candidatus Deferrimicrobiaceae bacterium]|nr:nitroreductase family protein [Candidatus Deferrimicrobiaceae bacterium]
MPGVIETIQKRRSTRNFLAHEVPSELVLECLAAAGWAPSAHNSQPWRFIVVSDPALKQKLVCGMAEAWAADLTRDCLTVDEEKRRDRVDRFAKAPVLILACLTMEGFRKFPDSERQGYERDLAVQSLGAGIQNLLLAATAAKLASCWFCAPGFCKETVRKILNIPADVEPHAFLILGYAGETQPTPPKKAISDYCFVNLWGKKLKI